MREFDPRKPCRRIGRFAVRFVVLCMPLASGAVEYTEGPAVAVRNFKGSGPHSEMGKGLSDMLVTDLVALTNHAGAPYKDCKMAVVEWEKRAEVQKEIDLQQRPEFDPSTRVKPGQWIDPQYFVEGSVSTSESAMSWSIQLRDVKTGRIVAKDDGNVSDNDIIGASEGIARRLIEKLCRQGKDYSGRPIASPAAPPAAPAPKPAPDKSPTDDVMNAIKGLKGLFGK